MMPESLENSQSSSDYFGEDDSQFLRALQSITLPGDKPQSEQIQRADHPSAIKNDSKNEETYFLPVQSSLKRPFSDVESEKDDAIYGASHFGQFGEYMRRKRAKLQIQNQELQNKTDSGETKHLGIFRGIAIHVSRTTIQNLISPNNAL